MLHRAGLVLTSLGLLAIAASLALAQDQPPAAQERSQRAQEAADRLADVAKGETAGGFREEATLEEQLTRQVDVVLLLDCSGSMRFALESAKTQFWRIASSISAAQPQPKLRIGLMAYGLRDQELPLVPLNDDLVAVFDALLRLDTSRTGGDEWIGAAMASAGERFWTPQATQQAVAMLQAEGQGSEDARPPTRLYFVFGNETVYQGPTDPVELARSLRPLGRVNTVHCISDEHSRESDADGWSELAQAGEGVAMRLDTTGDPMLIISPYDNDLARLSRRLTESYIPLGVLGDWMVQRRKAVEAAAEQWPNSVEADYVTAMAAWQKNEAVWDLVGRVLEILKESDPRTREAMLRGNEYLIDLTAVQEAVSFIEAESLPRAFARMSIPERAAAVAKAATARQKLHQEIETLTAKRRYWILRKASEDVARRHWRWKLVLDLERALRDPLREGGYKFGDEE